ncbi:M20 metallopeptidase family protein [Sporomusa acidovorans]|uniref:N-acetylcysteine deacetylase n=1 Tax=Sporomusa acidovorans (strain ATCC 49682 / DSM 3132 / Mol) TaxID=1123286 RepID=A0ABZ3J1E0_SPOA4|nr:amidohydrolase [Sporomusa acidovorans]OZC24146.1 putative hydrolase YxeP [Sporomusa acidovorans DSM 3132]SDF37244.1 amidohydrolase [Sporomusa acidovorans]
MSKPVISMPAIGEMAKALSAQMTEWRHDFHAHPELKWEEVQTTAKIAKLLHEMGYEKIKVGFGGTQSGVVADLDTGKPGKVVALRADMDALPIQEENEISYKSTVEGISHACGHDAHTAGLLGAAQILMQLKNQLSGSIRLIFQPAEEGGGAKAMIAEGVLDGVDMIAGAHTDSTIHTGIVRCRAGAALASSSTVSIKITGVGGHGAMPQASIDPIVAGATIISTLQTIVSREITPFEPAVVTVGHFEAGKRANVIPNTAVMDITVRTLSPEVNRSMKERIYRIVKGITEAMRCTFEMTYTVIAPVLVNDAVQADIMKNVASELVGEKNFKESPQKMPSEDFSYYLEKVPGVYFDFGVRNEEKGITESQHHPKFNVDDECLWVDAALLVGYVVKSQV